MPTTPWKKSPAHLVERFSAALPSHPDLVRKPMFGYPAAFAHGNMACGLFEDAVIVRLGKEGAAKAIAADGATQFAPMPGRLMTGYVLVPASDIENRDALHSWLARGLDYALTLPKKQPRAAAKKTVAAKAKAKR